jgi:hypothetical protein
METSMNGQVIRQALLDAANVASRGSPNNFQTGTILSRAANKLNIRGDLETEQVLLTMWHDLFRQGMIAWGYDISNSQPPFCHLTEQGRKVLCHMSRDPANPDGYMAHVDSHGVLSATATSYLNEALQTFNSGCAKATAVMIGGAAECVILDVRDTLVSKLNDLGQTVPKSLNDWKVKTVLNSIQTVLDSKTKSIPYAIADNFKSYWPAFTQQIRVVRNDAGHPASIDSVTFESVYAALLIFPELVKLADELSKWIKNDMK